MNLLTETILEIKENGHLISDVGQVVDTVTGQSCSWMKFRSLSNIEYNDCHGPIEILGSLVIEFSCGSRLERRELDGSEWWDYVPTRLLYPNCPFPIKTLLQ